MTDKVPQPTAVLVKRLRRVARHLDVFAAREQEPGEAGSVAAAWRARANTCWQAATRLKLLIDPNAERCEGCRQIATREDDAGVSLCDDCYAALDPTA